MESRHFFSDNETSNDATSLELARLSKHQSSVPTPRSTTTATTTTTSTPTKPTTTTTAAITTVLCIAALAAVCTPGQQRLPYCSQREQQRPAAPTSVLGPTKNHQQRRQSQLLVARPTRCLSQQPTTDLQWQQCTTTAAFKATTLSTAAPTAAAAAAAIPTAPPPIPPTPATATATTSPSASAAPTDGEWGFFLYHTTHLATNVYFHGQSQWLERVFFSTFVDVHP